MISIRKEIEASTDEPNNVLKNAPHTLAVNC
jgi:glycine dehydrogenase